MSGLGGPIGIAVKNLEFVSQINGVIKLESPEATVTLSGPKLEAYFHGAKQYDSYTLSLIRSDSSDAVRGDQSGDKGR